jgi:hypothetical protein
VACHLRNANGVYDAIDAQAEAQGLTDYEVREFECLGACDIAPMASIDGRYVGPLDESDAGELVGALKDGRQPLPGRGLSDPDFRYPWAERGAAPNPPGPPEQPDVHPAGGTYKDGQLLEVPPAEGPPPHPRPIREALDPGTSVTPEEEPE